MVTGGCGFIGSAVVRALYRQTEAHIAIVDKLTYAAYPAALEEAHPSERVALHEMDLLDRVGLRELVSEFQPTTVLHLAAETHVDRSIDDPLRFVETNVLGTAHLLESLRIFFHKLPENDQRTFRVVHVSTDEVYGSLDTEGQFEIDSPYRPNSPYAASKAGADHLVRAWSKTYGLPVIFTHSCNNYGPYQFPEKLIPLMIWKAMRGEELPVYGSGLQVREWLYVDDHANALLQIAKHAPSGEIFHITSGESICNLDLVKLLVAGVEKFLPALASGSLQQRIRHVSDRPGHDTRYAISSEKLRGELGWAPTVCLDEGLKKTIDWYFGHSEFFTYQRAMGYHGDRLGCSIDK